MFEIRVGKRGEIAAIGRLAASPIDALSRIMKPPP